MSIERAQLLIQQHRPEMALQELQPVLADDPNSATVHLFMAECLIELDRYPEAQEHAEQAVHLGPDWDYPQYVMGRLMLHTDKPKRALQHAQEAVRLEPEDADNHGLLAGAYCSLYDWKQALEAATAGLALEPDHSACLNRRAKALTKLGKHDAAEETMRASLNRDPENPTTHANMGWDLLHQGRPKEAMLSFREALRLDPMSSWARAGLIEALKAKNPLYGAMLRYFLWIGGFSPRARIGLAIGAILGIRIVSRLLRASPALAPIAGVIIMAYIAFVLMTWTAKPCFDLLLLLSPMGRHALFRTQRTGAAWFGVGLLAASTVLVVAGARSGFRTIGWACILPFLFLFPLTIASRARPVLPLVGAAAYAIATLALLVAGFVFMVPGCLQYYVYACVAATWLESLVPRSPLDAFG